MLALELVVQTFGRRVSFLAEGVKRDSEEAHLLKTVPSEGAWRSEDEGEETLLTHSESESLGGGERKETRKQYGSTISCIWGEAVHGMRILWRP